MGQGRCEQRSEVFCEISKKMGGRGQVEGGGGQGGSERRIEGIEVFVKIQKKNGGGRVWGVRVGGGQGGCERRIEVFVKIQKKKLGGGRRVRGGSGLGSQGGCERRIEVFEKIPKKIGGSGWVCSSWGGGSGGWM